MACLAHSADGIHFETLQPSYEFPRTKAQCAENKPSFLGMAADAYVTPTAGEQRDVVWYRQNFGTSYGWREIRGLQVVEIKLCRSKGIWQKATNPKVIAALPSVRLHELNSSLLVVRNRLLGWYLDRLGKLERFRRQLYSVQLTKHSAGLYIGLATVLEWAKDVHSEPVGAELPSYTHDTTNVYLVTSRDGVHIDDGWIYAHRPLIPKGALQKDWNAGFFLPAAQIVNDARSHRVYYEARSGSVHHENRFEGTALIGAALWQRDRIAGIRQSHARSPGIMVTKAFRLRGDSLWVDVDTAGGNIGRRGGSGAQQGAAGEVAAMGSVSVDVLDDHGTIVEGFSKELSSLLVGSTERDPSGMLEVRWADANGAPSRSLGEASRRPLSRAYGRKGSGGALGHMRLRFSLTGGAKLYSFQIRAGGADSNEFGDTAPPSAERKPPRWMCCSQNDPTCRQRV